MTRVRCPHSQCIYWDDGYCSAETIELDPETLACITMEEIDDLVLSDEVGDWDENDEGPSEKGHSSEGLWDEEDDIVIEPLEELAEEEWKEEDEDF